MAGELGLLGQRTPDCADLTGRRKRRSAERFRERSENTYCRRVLGHFHASRRALALGNGQGKPRCGGRPPISAAARNARRHRRQSEEIARVTRRAVTGRIEFALSDSARPSSEQPTNRNGTAAGAAIFALRAADLTSEEDRPKAIRGLFLVPGARVPRPIDRRAEQALRLGRRKQKG